MDIRLSAAIAAARATTFAVRVTRRGGGTALPGLIAERIDAGTAEKLAAQLGRGAAIVTGTNGKTTAARMLASIAREARIYTVHNREGSNLMRGIAGSLIANSSVTGRLRRGDQRLGIFEVDEATMPAASAALRPRAIAFINLFRDQLDRYGEVDTVFRLWQEATRTAGPATTLVLNADDPSVAELSLDWPGPIHWFGVDDRSFANPAGGAFDARWCRVCGGSFVYETRYFAHVGLWRCTGCGRSRPTPETSATDIQLALESAAFTVPGLGPVQLPLTGLYNVYNALAAIGLARVSDVPPDAILSGLARVRPAFGRQEVVELQGRCLRLYLSKNPAGANQVLQLLAAIDRPALNVAVLLNDRFADGQDVSWIWDVDFEPLAPRIANAWVAGDRVEDIALRLRYAGWPAPNATVRRPGELLDAILASTTPGEDIFVLPTYTSMVDLRAELVRRHAAPRFWQS